MGGPLVWPSLVICECMAMLQARGSLQPRRASRALFLWPRRLRLGCWLPDCIVVASIGMQVPTRATQLLGAQVSAAADFCTACRGAWVTRQHSTMRQDTRK